MLPAIDAPTGKIFASFYNRKNEGLVIKVNNTIFENRPFIAVLEYIKSTDGNLNVTLTSNPEVIASTAKVL